jgi:hypothetical protein
LVRPVTTNGDDVPVADWPPTTVKAPLGVAKTVTVEAPTGLVNATDTWVYVGVTTIFVTSVVIEMWGTRPCREKGVECLRETGFIGVLRLRCSR